MIRRVDTSHRRPQLPKPTKQTQTPRRLVSRDELSTGRGAALRARLLQGTAKTPPATYTVQPGDSYHRIAQNRATELLQQRGLTKGDASWSTEWHRLSYQLVQELMAANGGRPLRPGDQLPVVGGAQPAPKPPVDTAPVTPSTPNTPATPATPSTPTTPTPPGEFGSAMVNQFAGDSDGRNANCGFASSLMSLKLLGIDTSALGGSDYEKAMKLRQLGGGGTNDRDWGTVAQVVRGLNAAGAHAEGVPNTWGADKAKAVEVMKQAFLSGKPMAFVVAGNPALGWPNEVSYNGGHFVTVAGYDQASNTFTVMDPVAKKPIQVTPDQLANYLKDGNAELGEVVQVTP